MVHKPQNGDTLHNTGCGIAQKLAAGLECSIDANFMLWRCKEIARFRRVVGGLLGDVVGAGSVGVVPVAGEGLSKNGVKWLLDSSIQVSDCVPRQTACGDSRWFDVPSTQVKFDYGDEALDGVLNL